MLEIYMNRKQEIATLFSEKLTPGNYKYTWEASGFANGSYYYKIEGDLFVQNKKFILGDMKK